jgi:hypothetical protein
MARQYLAGKDIFKVKVKGKRRRVPLRRDMYITQEWQAFIREIPVKSDTLKLALLDKKLNFKGWANAEIATDWFVLGIESNYKSIRPKMEKFLLKVGRRKFLLPIYNALTKNPDDLRWALKVYEKARPNYHAVSQNTLDQLLNYKTKSK